MQVESTIQVKRPIETVFTYITNPSNIKLLGLKEIRQTSPGPIGIGTTFDLVIDVFGRDISISAAVTSYQPYSSFTMKTTSGPFAFEQHVLLAPVETGTSITVTLDGDPGKAFKFAGPLLKTQLKKQLEEQMNAARDQLDNGA